MPKKDAAEDDFGKGAKARAAKAGAASEKDAKARAAAEAAEAAEWSQGANSKAAKRKEEEEAARAAKAARKAEADAQLRAEEEEAKKAKLRGAEKVAVRKTAAVAAFESDRAAAAAPALTGTGIDAALAVMTIATAGGGGGADDDDDAAGAGGVAAAVGRDMAKATRMLAADAGGLVDADDKNPEKRMKAAFARYKEREMPVIKAEYPSLRMSQHLEILQRAWKKSPENPLVAHERLQQLAGGGK
jgi:hypothetical protein